MVPQIDPCMKNAILCVDSPSFRLCATITHRVVVKNQQKKAIFCTFPFATQQISLVSQIRGQDEILRRKLHISYIDQFVVPPIFKYLIGANDVEIRLGRTFDWHNSIVPSPSCAVGWPYFFPNFSLTCGEVQKLVVGKAGFCQFLLFFPIVPRADTFHIIIQTSPSINPGPSGRRP